MSTSARKKFEKTYSIGELSRRTGVHIETIRYYEREGMSPPPPRTEGGRRVYGPEDVRRLGFIRRARDLGFTLDEIRTLLQLGGPGRGSCAQVFELASAHLQSVRAKLADLARLEAILARSVRACRADESPDCPVLEMLDGAPYTTEEQSGSSC